jgi:membrane protease YdiL (CAAX protease family)
MDPERQPSHPSAPHLAEDSSFRHKPSAPPRDLPESRWIEWALIGDRGLRAGWVLFLLALLYRVFSTILGTIAVGFDPGLAKADFSPIPALIAEAVPLLALMGAMLLVARLEQRNLISYNLDGPRRLVHFLQGLGIGFAALSALVAAMAAGGWLQFGAASLSIAQSLGFALLWGFVFLLVGCFEEGAFRCSLQSILTRGVNFWWALAIVAGLCLDLLLRSQANGVDLFAILWMSAPTLTKGNGNWGVYAFALLGLVPCFLLQLKKTPSAPFWQAAWVTSTLFGFIHTGNNGENWIGIFAAAAIGFVFCVSVRLTGSAWWAIGCHAAWDWAETYFYGTADSGLAASGHLLNANPAGNPLWSGGADGPEGSLLVLVVIALLLALLLGLYGRGKSRAQSPTATHRRLNNLGL